MVVTEGAAKTGAADAMNANVRCERIKFFIREESLKGEMQVEEEVVVMMKKGSAEHDQEELVPLVRDKAGGAGQGATAIWINPCDKKHASKESVVQGAVFVGVSGFNH